MKIKREILFMGVFLWLCISTFSCAVFAPKKKNVVKEEAPVETAYQKILKGKQVETVRGMMTLHHVDGKLFVELPLTLLKKEMLVGSTITKTTSGNFGNVGEKPFDPFTILFQKHDSLIAMYDPTYGYCSEDPNIARRLEESMIGGIMNMYQIKAYNPDSTAVVIDMTDFFLSDNDRMSPFSDFSALSMMGLKVSKSYNRDRSRFEKIKAFEDNVSIQSMMTYTVDVNSQKGENVISQLPFTTVMTRSIILLPEEPMRPRVGDPRINVFVQGQTEIVANNAPDELMFVRRWRLEPKDEAAYRAGKLVEPKKPIVFYVDDAFPENWKQPIREAVENWQKAFEKIGFKNAIIAKDFPKNDPTFDPDNLKYSCVRYAPSWVENAMGPSWCDPRTGEILNASVYVYHNLLKLVQSWRIIQTAPADPDVRTMKFPREIMSECIKYVVTHEVGHCLSLMHNMSASAAVPVDSLRSPSFTQKYGTTYSIMDYARNNYVAQPGDKERGVRLTPPDLGIYDYYSIHWLYTPLLDIANYRDEEPVLNQWIDQKVGDPIYRYGKQQFEWPRYDPSSVEEDLGDDAMKASEYGIKNLKFIIRNLNQWVGNEDKDGSFRMSLYNEIVYTYIRYMNHVICNIGGIYLNERYDGDNIPFFQMVDKEKQRRATKFVLQHLNDLEWLNDPGLRKVIPLYGTVVRDLRDYIIDQMFARTITVGVCSDQAKTLKEAYTYDDFLNDIADVAWKGTRENRNLTDLEKKLQEKLLDTHIQYSALMFKIMPGGPRLGITNSSPSEGIIPEYIRAKSREDYGLLSRDILGVFTNAQGDVKTFPAINHEEISGFGLRAPLFGTGERYTPYYAYGCMKKTLALLKSKVSSAPKDAKQHYELLIYRLEKVLK